MYVLRYAVEQDADITTLLSVSAAKPIRYLRFVSRLLSSLDFIAVRNSKVEQVVCLGQLLSILPLAEIKISSRFKRSS